MQLSDQNCARFGDSEKGNFSSERIPNRLAEVACRNARRVFAERGRGRESRRQALRLLGGFHAMFHWPVGKDLDRRGLHTSVIAEAYFFSSES